MKEGVEELIARFREEPVAMLHEITSDKDRGVLRRLGLTYGVSPQQVGAAIKKTYGLGISKILQYNTYCVYTQSPLFGAAWEIEVTPTFRQHLEHLYGTLPSGALLALADSQGFHLVYENEIFPLGRFVPYRFFSKLPAPRKVSPQPTRTELAEKFGLVEIYIR